MAPTLLLGYPRRLAAAASFVLECRGPDAGWGLTPTSASSLVNTAEALVVLAHYDYRVPEVLEGGVGFLVRNLPRHTRDRESGGRGENTRFVAFALLGFAQFPDLLLADETLDSVEWALAWLGRNRVHDGWPESASGLEASIQQNAVVLYALGEIYKTVVRFSRTIGRVRAQNLQNSINDLVRHGVAGLLASRRPSDGAWPTGINRERLSPSKTALAVLALTKMAAVGLLDDALTSGRIWGRERELGKLDLVQESANWLSRQHGRWERLTEEDPEVPGTHWVHPAYAIGLAGAVTGGTNAEDKRLSSAWKYIDGLWVSSRGAWSEPGGVLTIRGIFHIVRAYESALERASGSSFLPEIAAEEAVEITALAYRDNGIDVEVGERTFRVNLSPRLVELVKRLEVDPRGLSKEDLAISMGLSTSSVAKYVERINVAAHESSEGYLAKIVSFADDSYCLASG